MNLFSKKSASDQGAPQSGSAGTSKTLPLLLLLLIGVFAYLYFFTNLIVPHESTEPKPAAPSPEVKQSMPPRPETAAVPAAGQPAAGQPTAVAPPAPAGAKPAPPAPAPAKAAPSAATAAKPAPPAAAGAKPTPAATATTKPATTKPATPAPAATAAKPAPPVTTAAKPAPPAAGKPAAPAAAAKEPAKPAAANAKGAKVEPAKAAAAEPKATKKPATYTLVAGPLPEGSALAAAEATFAKHHIKPLQKRVSRSGRTMNRLFFKSYGDYDAYAGGLETLKKSAKDAFAIEKGGKYFVYAGSYSSATLAQKEKSRLRQAGITVEIQKATLPGTSVTVTAGSFSSKAAANRAATAVAKDGLTVHVTPKGK